MSFLAEPPASAGAAREYEADLDSDGYVNNLTRVWCWRPDVLAAFHATTRAVSGETTLSRRDLAVLVVGAAGAREDSYCGLAWGRRLAVASDPATAAGALGGGADGLSEREAALLAWSRQVARDPNGTARSDVDRLRAVGLTDREIFEATAWVGLRLAFGTVNAALGALPDLQLAEAAPERVRAAVTFGRPPG